jgi:Domain of unknown function (DUF4398)
MDMLKTCRTLAYPGAASVALVLAACATLPPPTEQLAASRAAIQSAEVAGAGQSATSELAEAREKLSEAQAAIRDEDNARARRLAEEALVDAQLAQARASEARSRDAVAKAEETLRALREEANRPTRVPSTRAPQGSSDDATPASDMPASTPDTAPSPTR